MREAEAAKVALQHKIKSQSIKKSKRNQVGTLSELTTELTNAGYDTSKLQQRAKMIAKILGAKRKLDEVEGSDDDVDMEAGSDDEEGWMDVDDDDKSSPRKRVKTNSGSMDKRGPKWNRQLAGLRNEKQ